MKSRYRCNIFIRIVTHIVIVILLCENTALAGGNACRYIAPESIFEFENFDKFFRANNIPLTPALKLKIFSGFKRISESVVPLLEKDEVNKVEILREIQREFGGREKNIRFSEDSLEVMEESGNKFLQIDVSFIYENGKEDIRKVLFYNPERPPYNYLQNQRKNRKMTRRDRNYARERGFWIFSDLECEIKRTASELKLPVIILDDPDKFLESQIPGDGFLIIRDGAKFIDEYAASCDTSTIAALCEKILNRVLSSGTTKIEQSNLAIAVSEISFILLGLFVRAIIYGNKCVYRKPVAIRWHKNDAKIVFEVYDTNIEGYTSSRVPNNLKLISGYGRDTRLSTKCSYETISNRSGKRIGTKSTFEIKYFMKRTSPEGRRNETGGALKILGPALDQKIIDEAIGKESKWREQAKQNNLKLFRVNDLPEGLIAWHFREDPEDNDSPLIIVTRAQPERISYLDKLIYHETKESEWLKKGLTRREAHILASAEQILNRKQNNELILSHEKQFEYMTIQQLHEIIKEVRDYHYQILRENNFKEKDIEEIKEYETLLKIKAYERIIKEYNSINNPVGELHGAVQRVRDITKLQFAVPVNVLKKSVDFTLALKKMEDLREEGSIFELFVYDVEEEDNSDYSKLTEKLGLNPRKVKIYIIKKTPAYDFYDAVKKTEVVRDYIRENYPLDKNKDGCFMIVTEMLSKSTADAVKKDLDFQLQLEEYESAGVIIKPEGDEVLSLSGILINWLSNLNADDKSRIRIILPSIPLAKEVKELLESELSSLWSILKSA